MSVPYGLNPPLSGMYERFGMGQLPNPFFTTANQFIPRNFHDVIKWSRFITTQSPTTTEVIRKLSTYPITDFVVDSSQEKVRENYKKIHKSIKIKQKLADVGFDYYTLGNVFCSIYFPFDRHLKCPHCHNLVNARTALDTKMVKWKRFAFQGICPSCSTESVFHVVDSKSNDISRINIVKWKPENIAINHNPVTDESEYYYTIPGDVKKKVLLGDPMFLSTIPWAMIESIKHNQEFKFDNDNIFHLAALSMGNMINGFGVPTLLCLYSLVFYQAMLRKANEAVAAEHMTPLRMLFPQQASPAGDPVSMLSMQGFTKNVTDSIKRFKNDPNQVLISPIPIGYQNMGGQGKALLVSQEIQQAEETMLLAMGVSRELLSGTTNWTSSTVGLRLLENTMNGYVGQISTLIEWIYAKIAKYLGIEAVDVSLVPFKLTDNDAVKPLLGQLAAEGNLAISTYLESIGFDFNEEQDRIVRDQVTKAETQIRTEHEVKVARFMRTKDLHNEDQDDNGFKQSQDQAHEIANSIMYNTPPEQQMAALSQIRQQDEPLYSQVVEIIKESMMTQQETGLSQLPPEGEEEGGAKNPPKPSGKPEANKEEKAKEKPESTPKKDEK